MNLLLIILNNLPIMEFMHELRCCVVSWGLVQWYAPPFHVSCTL